MSLDKSRIAIFGGTFDPVHMGHINCVRTVKSRLGMEKIFVIPAAQNPRKPMTEGPTEKQRFAMCELGFQSDSEYVVVDDRELVRGGISYSVTTVESFAREYELDGIHLVIGIDQFEQFDRWHRFERILELSNLIVVSRPGHSFPVSVSDFPEPLQSFVTDFERGFAQLTTGRHIEFLKINDVDISASDLRKRLRTGRSVERYLTLEVEDYIKSNSLYGPIGPKIGDFEEFSRFCGQALFDKKALNLKGYDLRKLSAPTEFALVASGTSSRHAAALAEGVLKAVKEEFNVYPQSIEGIQEGRWVLLDYGSLIIHVFYDFVRNEYRLEELWAQARDLGLKDQLLVEKPK